MRDRNENRRVERSETRHWSEWPDPLPLHLWQLGKQENDVRIKSPLNKHAAGHAQIISRKIKVYILITEYN